MRTGVQLDGASRAEGPVTPAPCAYCGEPLDGTARFNIALRVNRREPAATVAREYGLCLEALCWIAGGDTAPDCPAPRCLYRNGEAS
jgi:hypothetical protein